MKSINELLEETSGATIHFYYSKQRSKWVCWYGVRKFFIAVEFYRPDKILLDNNKGKLNFTFDDFTAVITVFDAF